MTIAIEDGGSEQGPLPSYQPVRPCYLADLRVANVPTANVHTLDLQGGPRRVRFNNNGDSMTWAATHAGGNSITDWPPIGEINLGEVYEFTVGGIDDHPLHIHVNPYQIVEIPTPTGYGGGYFQVGDWHDTLMLPIQFWENGVSKIRMNTDR